MKDKHFMDGIWFTVQHLVLVQDRPAIASDIISEAGMSQKDCVEAQRRSGHMDERMMEFIDRQLKYDK